MSVFMLCTSHQTLFGLCQIKKTEMVQSCGKYGGEESCI